MATKKTIQQLTAALALAVIAATAHGVFFAPTEAVSNGAPAAGIRLSTWDDYQKEWSIYFVEQHLNDAVNNPAGTIRHSEGAIIELRPVSGELTFDQVPAGLAYTVINDLNALGITAPGTIPVDKDGVEQPQLTASGTPVYIQLNVSTVATSVPPPVNHQGPWAGPIDPTDDDLAALDAGGSVGEHAVTLGATGDTVSFTWDIGRWAKGDIFLGLNNHTYKVLDRFGNFKRFVATADLTDPDHAAFEWYNETSGCATNWKTGEMFATNFGDGMPAVNVITRHPSAAGTTLYSPLSRRVSTRIERPDFWSWWGIDSNPESVAFDANMNMYVGHSFGNQDDRPVVGDQAYWNGMGFDMFNDSSWYPMAVDGLPREWADGGSGFIVDETGAKMKLAEAGAPFASYVERIMDLVSPRMQYEADGVTLKFGPAPPAVAGLPDWPAQLPLTYLASPANGNPYQRLDANDVIVDGLVPSRWSMGKRLHRYNIQPDGSYLGSENVTPDRDVFWTFTGRQGTDWMDINSTGDVVYYTSEDSFIHRYRVRLNPEAPGEPIGQLPDLGNGRISVPGSADRKFNGLRILPPGDGTGGFLVASTGAIHRLRADGSWVQSFAISDDAYLWEKSGNYSGAAVNGWYSIEVDPGGRTLWAAPTDTGWVYVFDIATGKEVHRFEATKHQPYGHPDGARFVQSMCIMWEYTAAQEICGNAIDDDGDGFVDENCKAIEVCSTLSPGDDNGDGLADANDPDCGADEAPVAVDDYFETVQDVPIAVAVNAANQVLKNDSDPDNADASNPARHDVLTVGLVGTSGTPATVPGGAIATTQGGTVVLNADGSMTYMPAAGFHGLDTFVYQATDAVIPFEGQNYSNTATVTILVRPLVDNDHYEIEQGTSLDVAASSVTPPALLSNDRSDGLTIIGAGPTGITPLGVNPSIQFVKAGSGATVVVYADGRFTYTPPANFVGTDTFLYRGNDGVSDSINDALVTIVVTPVSTTIVTTDPDPSVYGSPATVRATVTCGASQTPSVGTVTFRLGAQVIATNVPVTNGVATTTLPAALVVGNYTVTAEYSGSASVAPLCPGSGDDDPHQVVPKPATVTANPQTKPYGTVFTFNGTEFTTSGFIFEDEVLSATLVSATGSPATATVAGSTYPIVPSNAVGVGLENYTITYINGPLTVTPVPLVIAADDKSKVYDGAVYSPFTVVYSGFVNGDDAGDLGGALTLSGAATTAVNAGTYADGIVPAGHTSTNYTITYEPGTLTITPAPLVVTADDKSKFYDGQVYPGPYTVTYAGFVNDEDPSDLGGALTFSGAATTAVNPGTYTGGIVPSGYTSTNYVITYVPGTLRIDGPVLIVTADDKSKAYDGTVYSPFTVTYSGFIGDDDPSDLGGTLVFSGAATSAVNVGTYTGGIVPSGYTSSVYTIQYVAGTLDITPVPLVVTADDKSKPYDGTVYSPFTVTYSGFVGGDDASDLGGALTFSGSATTAVNVGTYTDGIVPAGYTSSNYTISYVPGTLTITPVPLVVTAADKSKPYDGTVYSPFTVTYSGFVGGDDAGDLGGALTYSGSATTAVNVGTYTDGIVPAGYTSTNYTISYVPGTLTITPIPVTVKANDKTIYVGDPLPTLDGVWTGFIAGESATAIYATTAVDSNTTGTFPITPTPVNSPVLANYIVTVVPGTLTILPRVVVCTPTGYVTYSQGGWGAKPSAGNPGALLAANFATVYPEGVVIGGTRTLTFRSAAAVEAFLPAGGSSKVLNASAVDPTKSSAGVFAGQLLALQLAVDFSEAGVLQNGLGAMVMQSGPMAGKSVSEILEVANIVLGGQTSALPSGMSVSGLSNLLESIIMNYHEGADGGLLACGSGNPPPPPPPPANRPPVAQDDSATTITTTPVSIVVLANDSDPDGDVVTVVPTGFTQPANGSVTLSNNVFRFVAVSGFTGTTTFTYTITDGKGGTDSAVVTVVVTGSEPPPPPPTAVCSFRTQTQGGWGANPSGGNAAAFLKANFAAVFGSGGAVIGAGTRTLTFTSSDAVRRFLPAGGTAGTISSSATNPGTSSAGVFAGQVLALRISVAFSNAGITTSGLGALTVKSGTLAGKTVAEVLDLANRALAGQSVGYSISTLNTVVDAINNNFVDGNTNKGYLNTGTCPTT